MAPEVMLQSRSSASGGGYGCKADIWSLGCVLIEMATAAKPWGHMDNCLAAMVRISMSQETPPVPREKLSAAAQDVVVQCTRRAPEERPAALALLSHEFLQGDAFGA